MKEKNIELAQLLTKKNSAAQQPLDQQQGQEQHPAAENGAEVRRDSFQYQSRVAPKKLLCLKVWSHPTQPATRFLVFFKCFSSVHCVRRRVDVYNQRGATISPFQKTPPISPSDNNQFNFVVKQLFFNSGWSSIIFVKVESYQSGWGLLSLSIWSLHNKQTNDELNDAPWRQRTHKCIYFSYRQRFNGLHVPEDTKSPNLLCVTWEFFLKNQSNVTDAEMKGAKRSTAGRDWMTSLKLSRKTKKWNVVTQRI